MGLIYMLAVNMFVFMNGIKLKSRIFVIIGGSLVTILNINNIYNINAKILIKFNLSNTIQTIKNWTNYVINHTYKNPNKNTKYLVVFGIVFVISLIGKIVYSGNTLEKLASIKNIVFDKTGTLTTGKFIVSEFIAIEG